jgi:hypothetical protein
MSLLPNMSCRPAAIWVTAGFFLEAVRETKEVSCAPECLIKDGLSYIFVSLRGSVGQICRPAADQVII